MVNLTQVILVAVITTLTVLLTFIGIQVAQILKDLRETLRRVNKVVEHAESIAEAVVKPVTGISSLVEGIQSSMKIAELLGMIKKGGRRLSSELPEKVENIRERLDEFRDGYHESNAGIKSEDIVHASVREKEPTGVKIPKFFHRGGVSLG